MTRAITKFAIFSAFIGTLCFGASDRALSQQPIKLKVGILPSVNAAPFHLAVKKGFFREEGLEVEPQIMGGGSELTIALVSGTTQFSHVGMINSIIARSKGLPIKLIAAYLRDQDTPEKSFTMLVVRKDSGIKSIKDLPGKTIASNEIRAFGEVVIKASLEKQGVDPSSVKITEIPFPEMNAALDTKRIDAIWQIEPFLTASLDAGNIGIDAPTVTVGAGKPFVDGGWMTTERYAASNPDVVDRFVRAINKATRYAAANIDEVRATIPTFSRVSADAAKRIRLPHFDPELDRTQLQTAIDLTHKYGIIERKPSVNELVR